MVKLGIAEGVDDEFADLRDESHLPPIAQFGRLVYPRHWEALNYEVHGTKNQGFTVQLDIHGSVKCSALPETGDKLSRPNGPARRHNQKLDSPLRTKPN